MMIEAIDSLRHVHPHFFVAHLDWIDTYIVRPRIKCAPAGKVETRVVPVAGKDALFDRSAVQRKPHVGAAVVDGVHVAVVEEQRNRLPLDMNNLAASALHLIKAGSTDECRSGRRRSFGIRFHRVFPAIE